MRRHDPPGMPHPRSLDRTILGAVGRTPLLELSRLAAAVGLPPDRRLFAKAENLNPGGSCKDRLALALIDHAERNGLRPGGTIVEATSGNTGIALAMAAAVRGYRLSIVTSTKAAPEKLRVLRALGASVRITPNVPHGSPDHYIEVARRLAAETPGAVFLDQFHSLANLRVHEECTGPELLHQVLEAADRLDAFVCGAGTGGTLMGVARYLRRASPGTRIVLADPDGSVLSGARTFRPYLVEGIGDDTQPPLFDPTLLTSSVTIPDRESFHYALLAARREGLVIGGSGGCHLAAAVRVARALPSDSVVATILPDSGWNYLSKFFDPKWCAANGLEGLHAEVDG